MVKNKYAYNTKTINALENSISSSRLSAYLLKTSNNKEKALELYAWNTEISAELYAPLQGLEIALRNAMHRELSKKYGYRWYNNQKCEFNHIAIQQIITAKEKLKRGHYPIDTPHIIAELTFGFWVSLLGKGGETKNYEMTLWRAALYKAFPHNKDNRRNTHKPLERLRMFRNRIAHHEPIFNRRLEDDYKNIIKIIGWICPETASWVDYHNSFNDIFLQKPD